jgi:catechol 2,3-dioxygenase-like lactoylglutathione lyase family enzyme
MKKALPTAAAMLTGTAAATFVLAGAPTLAQAQLAPMNPAGLTYGHVHLNVTDAAFHRQFWVEHFGGEAWDRGLISGVTYPGMMLVFTERAPTGGSMGTVMDHFGYKVRDIEPMLAKWREAGYEVQSEFTGAEGFPNAYLMGPDSVRIELQEDPTQEQDVIAYHIHFFTPEFQSLLQWYVDTFGLEPFQRGTIATTANAPGMNLSFGNSQGGQPRAATRGRAIDHIGFEVENLDAFAAALQAKGITFDVAPREVASIGLKIAFLTDPSGVYIELTEGFDDY